MKRIEKILEVMRRDARGIRFSDLCLICDHFFRTPRHSGSSHRIYRMPWPDDPRVNVQESKGLAKAYQVKQVLKAIDQLLSQSGGNNETKN